MYLNGLGVKEDYAKAIKYYKLAAKQGDDDAQAQLGVMYIGGHGVKKNQAKAIKYFKLAAKQGNRGAIHLLSLLNGKYWKSTKS